MCMCVCMCICAGVLVWMRMRKKIHENIAFKCTQWPMDIAFHTDVYEIQKCVKQTQATHPDDSTNLLMYLLCIYNIYMI